MWASKNGNQKNTQKKTAKIPIDVLFRINNTHEFTFENFGGDQLNWQAFSRQLQYSKSKQAPCAEKSLGPGAREFQKPDPSQPSTACHFFFWTFLAKILSV